MQVITTSTVLISNRHIPFLGVQHLSEDNSDRENVTYTVCEAVKKTNYTLDKIIQLIPITITVTLQLPFFITL